ncbi:MAG: UpxY family transcription antiterminator [Muribaculaceae bacterium]|nr:UpxY family transcription antiterminator [Muribaculaceae bacterium]MDE6754409.1 UpxY family transcription antiterminator [Muribaculaceae bacterium]
MQKAQYSSSAPKTTVSDDAVGVPQNKWFVAIVNHNNEHNAASRLKSLGYDVYVASQVQLRQRANGRKVKVDRLVIPSKVFIHCTEQQRRQIVTLPYVNRFMTNIAGTAAPGMHKPLVVIPPYQMNILQFMLGHAENPVSLVSLPYKKGEAIRVVRGSLAGLTGEIFTNPEGSEILTVSLDALGYATVKIEATDVERLN